MGSATAGTLVTTGLKRLVDGPCWNLNWRFPACARTQRTNVLVQFPCSVSSEKGMSVLPLQKDMFVSPIHSVFLFSCSQNCVHFCTQLSQCTHNSQPCMHLAQAQGCVVRIKISSSPCHPCLLLRISVALTLHLQLSHLLPRSLHLEQPLRSRCRSINTALLRQMRSLALWPKPPLPQVMSPTWSTTSTTQRLLKSSSRSNPAMPSYLHDAELSDETIGKALSSPLFTQEREEPAGRRQAFHSFEESLLPCQSLSVCHVSPGRPVNELSSRTSCSREKPSREMEKFRKVTC